MPIYYKLIWKRIAAGCYQTVGAKYGVNSLPNGKWIARTPQVVKAFRTQEEATKFCNEAHFAFKGMRTR